MIEKAIKKGPGELEAESYEEVRYEGYGPGGVAIMADAHENRNMIFSRLLTMNSPLRIETGN